MLVVYLLKFFLLFCGMATGYFFSPREIGNRFLVSVESRGERVCTGVYVSRGWVLTIGDCTQNGYIKRYTCVFEDGSTVKVFKKIMSKGRRLALLQIDDSALRVEDPIELKVDNRDITPGSDTDTIIYAWEKQGGLVSMDIELIRDGLCMEKLKSKDFRRSKHDCFVSKSKNPDVCKIPSGQPIFGKVRDEWILHGFTHGESNLCEKEYKQAIKVYPHTFWLKHTIGCRLPPTLENGVLLFHDNDVSIGAKAEVVCDDSFIANYKKIKCKTNGNWQTPKCEVCTQPIMADGVKYRLCDGGQPFQGRVELMIDGVWGTVCSDQFDDNEAKAICKMLGYEGGTAVTNAHFGEGSGKIWLDNLQCFPNTKYYLHQCVMYTMYTTTYQKTAIYNEIGEHSCDHSQDAGVICEGGEGSNDFNYNRWKS